MIVLDKAGKKMNRDLAHFAIQYLDANCSHEFARWRMNPVQKTVIHDGLEMDPKAILAGIQVVFDTTVEPTVIELLNKAGEAVVRIENVEAR